MKTTTLLIAFAISLAGCSPADQPAAESSKAAASDTADTVYTNGKIYTVNDAQPWAEAVAIKDGKFQVIGSAADVAAVTGESTTVIDLGGKFAMPGLIDAHTHLMAISVDRVNLSITNANDKDAMLEEIKAYAKANPDAPYIRGGNWNLGVFENDSPRKEWLDAIDSTRPIYLYSQTGHEAWVNSAVIDLIDIKNREQDNRYIWDVDPETGEPSGTIREFSMSLVEQALEPAKSERLAPELATLITQFSEQGFTAAKEAGAEVWTVQAANMLDKAGTLNMRLFPAWFHLGHIGAMTAEQSKATAAKWEDYESAMVYPRYVKMYADGSSISHSSLLFDDYADRPGFKGAISFPYETYVEDFSYFNNLGLGMMVHVYGDGTSEKIIEAFEAVRQRNGDNGLPLHFSHSFMITPDQIARLAKISDVSMDFMTLQYPHDSIIGSFVLTIGEERYQKWLNARAAAENDIPFGFGSDWPSSVVPVLNGFYEMQGFVTRRNPYEPEKGTLNASQAITLEQAVYGFTMGGAHTLGFDWPEKIGSIEEGKLADFIVTDRNIFEIPIETLKDTKVEKTVVGGRVVFERE